MKEARAVIARLDRIEAMERARDPAVRLLNELESLIPEARRWLEREGPEAIAARFALERCLLALEAGSRSSSIPATGLRHTQPRRAFARLPPG